MDQTEFPLFTESGRFISYNYYDKKGYSFSQTTNALSLAVNTCFICWKCIKTTTKRTYHTCSKHIHSCFQLDETAFNKQTT